LRIRLNRFTLAGLAGFALFGAACGAGEDAPTSKIFAAPPWESSERATYDLLDEGRRLYGVCILETASTGATTELARLCTDSEGGGNRDDGSAVVDSGTLQPISSQRVLVNTDSGTRTEFSGEYLLDSVVLSHARSDLQTPEEIEDERRTVRDLPEPDDRSPDPGYYDDESLFWLVRGIPLEEGWEGAYHNVNLGTAGISVAEVFVEQRETIAVPAGEFETWRIRLRTASITQRIWVEVEAPHRMIRADIERARYELRSFE
jgi:hypothetical protein